MKVLVDVPEEDWIRQDAPALQIIDAEIWAAVRRRFERNPSFGGASRAPRGLLTGNLRCGTCGARVYVVGGVGGMGERVYGCGRRHEGGSITCRNKAKRPTAILDRLVAKEIQARFEAQDVLDTIVAKAVGVRRQQQGREASAQQRAQARLDAAVRGRDNLVRAVAAMDDPETLEPLLAALKAAQGEVSQLESEVEGVGNVAQVMDPAEIEVRGRLRRKLEDLPSLLASDVGRGRDVLRGLLAEPLKALPIRDCGEDRWLIRGNLRAVGLFQECGDPNGI